MLAGPPIHTHHRRLLDLHHRISLCVLLCFSSSSLSSLFDFSLVGLFQFRGAKKGGPPSIPEYKRQKQARRRRKRKTEEVNSPRPCRKPRADETPLDIRILASTPQSPTRRPVQKWADLHYIHLRERSFGTRDERRILPSRPTTHPTPVGGAEPKASAFL